MSNRVINKSLAAQQDLLFGEGLQEQKRAGGNFVVDKIRNIYPVNSLDELNALDTEQFPKARLYLDNSIVDYKFDGEGFYAVYTKTKANVVELESGSTVQEFVFTTQTELESLRDITDTNSTAITLLDAVSSYDQFTRTQSELKQDAPNAQIASLPRFVRKLSNYDYGFKSQSSFTIVGMGSSVGNGATLPDPVTQSPVVKFFNFFMEQYNAASVYPISVNNRSVGGSTIFDGNVTHWPALLADGVKPDLVVLAYGMNDAATAMFNSGNTFNGFKRHLRELVNKIKDYGADVVVMTTPHSHSTLTDWSLPTTIDMLYPEVVTKPVADSALYPTVANSVITGDFIGDGSSVPAAHRFLRINEAMRQIAGECGVSLVDVEKYWFEAIRDNGEDALFDTGEFNHPNLLGHTLSYWQAMKAFNVSLAKSVNMTSNESDIRDSIVLGPDATQISYDLNEKLDYNPTAPLTVFANDKWDMAQAVYGEDGKLNHFVDTATHDKVSVAYNQTRTSARNVITHNERWLNKDTTQTFAVPDGSFGEFILNGFNTGISGVRLYKYAFSSRNGVIQVALISDINTTQPVSEMFVMSFSGLNIQFTPEAANTNVEMSITYWS